MKKYTQQEFDDFEVINGVKQCPGGDYTDICIFSVRCRFGEQCSFGERCSFGEWCSFGKCCSFGECCSFEGKGAYIGKFPFIKFGGFGSRVGSEMYVFNLEQGLWVRCGCWLSTINDFRKRVVEEQADQCYLDCADLSEKKFNSTCNENN